MPRRSYTHTVNLLSPIDPYEFVSQGLWQNPLYISGHTEKFAGLITVDEFIDALRHVPELRAGISSADRKSTEFRGIRHEEAMELYNTGATICATGLDRVLPKLASLSASVKFELGCTGAVNVRGYWSNDSSGFTTHFDARAVTVLQISGSKLWSYSPRPAIEYPLSNCTINDQVPQYIGRSGQVQGWEVVVPPSEGEMRTVVLNPGDVLYLPAGSWHSAQALGHSFALNLAFNYLEGGSTFNIFSDMLKSMLEGSPKWRGTPPLCLHHQNADGQLDPTIRDFFDDRLNELREILVATDSNSYFLTDAWRRRTVAPSHKNENTLSLRSGVEERLQMAPDALITCGLAPSLCGSPEQACLYFGVGDRAGRILFSQSVMPLLQYLCTSRETFCLEDCIMGTNDPNEAKEVLDQLLGLHILQYA